MPRRGPEWDAPIKCALHKGIWAPRSEQPCSLLLLTSEQVILFDQWEKSTFGLSSSSPKHTLADEERDISVAAQGAEYNLNLTGGF
ncbi:unnamed protein product [Leuciscus chuanchicus]